MPTSKLLASLAAASTVALILVACSYLWTYEYEVSVAADVSLDASATLIMAQAPVDGGIEDIQDTREVSTSADTRDYSDDGEVCCSPSETVSLYAFLDLDQSGAWEPGEPWGADPNNPVIIDSDGYVSKIVVENDAP